MKLFNFIGKFFLFLLFHIVRLGRNVAHFFFRIVATVSLVTAYFAFNDYLVGYGFESYTAYLLLTTSFIFSLLPWAYDELLLANLIPDGQTVHL